MTPLILLLFSEDWDLFEISLLADYYNNKVFLIKSLAINSSFPNLFFPRFKLLNWVIFYSSSNSDESGDDAYDSDKSSSSKSSSVQKESSEISG